MSFTHCINFDIKFYAHLLLICNLASLWAEQTKQAHPIILVIMILVWQLTSGSSQPIQAKKKPI
jgi:hypothetical protein